MSTELTIKQPSSSLTIFGDADRFDQAQRQCMALAKSDAIPKLYQNNLPNCLVAMDTSQIMGMSVLQVMRNMHIIQGMPGWKSEYVIGAVNTSGLFAEELDFHYEGAGDDMTCYAYTKKKNGKEVKGSVVSIKMAKSQGWYSRSGSKWPDMPEQMLAYRAATFFSRLYCPQVLNGMSPADEIQDVGFAEESTTSIKPAMDKLNAEITGKTQQEDSYAFEDVVDEPSDENLVVTEQTESEAPAVDTDNDDDWD